MECGRGCGETLEFVRRDHLFTDDDGKKVLVEDVELLECAVCGDVSIPSRSSKLVADYFHGDMEASGVSEIPTIQAKTA
ncbi:MAG: YgiT-type zinc finger protein [bacterium]